MSESLWSASAGELLRRTASSAPTPGGGAIAAVTGAFGAGLVLMALEVTNDASLTPQLVRGRSLFARIRDGADRDVVEFEAVMSVYAMPKVSDTERVARSVAMQQACAAATLGPLELAEALLEVIALANEVESLVKPTIASDVAAGRDIAVGAARAALHTADINLSVVRDADLLRARRNAVADALENRR